MRVGLAYPFMTDMFRTHFPELSIIKNPLEVRAKPYDLIIFPGGEDVHPSRYGESINGAVGWNIQRDETELAILNAIMYGSTKVLGVCRGMQLINVFLGGSLFQDLNQQHMSHKHVHKLEQRSEAFSWLTTVNSLHHQALRRLGGMNETPLVSASDYDYGLPEMIVWSENMMGVQFHPELFDSSGSGKRFFDVIGSWVAGETSLFVKDGVSASNMTTNNEFNEMRILENDDEHYLDHDDDDDDDNDWLESTSETDTEF